MKSQRAYGNQEDRDGREFSQSDSKGSLQYYRVKIVWSILIEWTNRPMG